MYHNNYQQFSKVVQVPSYITTSMFRTLQEIFERNVFHVFRRRATTLIKKYEEKSQRSCRFIILFDAPLELPDKAESIISKILDWTLVEAKTEYYRKHSEKMKKEITSLRNNYRELKLNKKLI